MILYPTNAACVGADIEDAVVEQRAVERLHLGANSNKYNYIVKYIII